MPDLVLKHPTGSAGGKPVLFYTTEEVGGEVGGSRRGEEAVPGTPGPVPTRRRAQIGGV